jgi:hypothetical protein
LVHGILVGLLGAGNDRRVFPTKAIRLGGNSSIELGNAGYPFDEFPRGPDRLTYSDLAIAPPARRIEDDNVAKDIASPIVLAHQ